MSTIKYQLETKIILPEVQKLLFSKKQQIIFIITNINLYIFKSKTYKLIYKSADFSKWLLDEHDKSKIEIVKFNEKEIN